MDLILEAIDNALHQALGFKLQSWNLDFKTA